MALLRPRPDDYARRTARAEDVWLLVEVADTTYRYDRGVKLPIYARAGVRELWLIDLSRDVVEVYRRPHPRGLRDECKGGARRAPDTGRAARYSARRGRRHTGLITAAAGMPSRAGELDLLELSGGPAGEGLAQLQ